MLRKHLRHPLMATQSECGSEMTEQNTSRHSLLGAAPFKDVKCPSKTAFKPPAKSRQRRGADQRAVRANADHVRDVRPTARKVLNKCFMKNQGFPHSGNLAECYMS